MTEPISATFPYVSKFVEVKGSRMHYVDQGIGHGEPLLFLHGNPTSCYLWRNVMPSLYALRHNIAPDLIGFGKSDKPDIPYRVFDHADYVEAFIDALGLERLGLVLHDWGGFAGLRFAARHPERVSAIAMMENVVKPMQWEDRSEGFQRAFRMLRSAAGEQKILEENFFVERILPGSIIRKLTDQEMEVYREPFQEKAARKPTLAFPRDIPIGGEPQDVVKELEWIDATLAKAGIPMLLLTFEPGGIVQKNEVEWCRATFPTLTIKEMGPGIHFVQEDQPQRIGRAIGSWLAGLEEKKAVG
jgi:haloalkane dehalogenase